MKKALYSLKQAPRTWYGIIDSFLSSLGFTKSKADSKLNYKVEDGNPVMLLLYVDDLFVTGMDGLIANAKRNLVAEFCCRLFTHLDHVAESFMPLDVSLGASLESRLSPCS